MVYQKTGNTALMLHVLSQDNKLRPQKCGAKRLCSLTTMFELVKYFASIPIHRTPSGWQFRLLSWEFLGCVLVYITIFPIYLVVIINDIYPQFQAFTENPSKNFNQQIYYELFTTLMVPYILTPLTTWLDAPQIAAYLNRCNGFQELFAKIAGRRLKFSLKTKPVLALCVICVIAQNAASQLEPPYLAFWKTPACSINMIALSAYLTYWICLTDCLSQAGEAIAHELKNELQSGYCDAKKIVRYQQLWLELSQLTSDASSHFHRTMSVPTFLSLFLITLAEYGLAANLLDPVVAAFYVLCTALNTTPLFLYCDRAHTTMAKVRDPAMKILTTVRRSRVDTFSWQAVRSFLEVIDQSPPIITLGGYVVIDRRFLHAAGATISTYIVVIFQFRMSLHANEKKPADGFEAVDSTRSQNLTSLE